METVKITIGKDNIYNVLLESGAQLDEVVVTAQGIKRERKSLGYAVAKVESEAIESDVANSLSGKSAGVQNRRIVLRKFS